MPPSALPGRARPCRAVLLLDGQGVRPRDGELVEEEQKLPEGLEEGPAGEQADALVGVDGPVGDELLLHGCQQAQLLLLPLAQLRQRVRLVELDGGAVYLQGGGRGQRSLFKVGVKDQITMCDLAQSTCGSGLDHRADSQRSQSSSSRG